MEAQLEAILGTRWNLELNQHEWLVQWEGLEKCEASWEGIDNNKEQLSNFHLEDKVYVTLGA